MLTLSAQNLPVSAGKVKNGNKSPTENGTIMKITGFSQEFEFEVNLNEPMQKLIRTIQPSLNFDLSKACIYLCGVQELTPATCLKNCVRDGSEGFVKVKLSVSYTQGQRPSINIEDVLQATQTPQASVSTPAPVKRSPLGATVEHVSLGKKLNGRKRPVSSHRVSAAKRKAANDQNQEWIEAEDFQALCRSNNIPQDVHDWSASNVGTWLGWAVKNFSLPDINMRLFSEMDGNAVCSLGRDMFRQLVGRDDRDLFWTHLEILRSKNYAEIPVYSVVPAVPDAELSSPKARVRLPNKSPSATGSPFAKDSGNVQLWTFLLELLMSGQHANALEWTSSDGEFRLLDPERVAELWGLRKNKPSMNYEKMSRALRYYYDGNILAKVQGKHFTYKFLNNLSEHANINKRISDPAVQNLPLNLSPRASNPSSPMTPASLRSESELSVEVPLPQERKSIGTALDLRRLSSHSLSQVAA
ncbi:DNA-binding protein Ets97D-like isoform X2 [Paramacrobiotus metropolitanus]|uniref:DNA-binding protein Ets97D-like isoform X2 n=1 Tax=Paramacrobiotus metropolitanus TaxID=2943436 RepID=UPI0024462C4A|nr:DNA-binding protein Ets97D-like isoform X2 [Paramacrobiotus metropolitanus]